MRGIQSPVGEQVAEIAADLVVVGPVVAVALPVDRVAGAYDNAMCESFFATLGCELLDRTRFTSSP